LLAVNVYAKTRTLLQELIAALDIKAAN